MSSKLPERHQPKALVYVVVGASASGPPMSVMGVFDPVVQEPRSDFGRYAVLSIAQPCLHVVGGLLRRSG